MINSLPTTKRLLVIAFCLVLLLSAVTLSSCASTRPTLPENATAEEAFDYLAWHVENRRLSDLRLTIYLATPAVTPFPYAVDWMRQRYGQRIEVSGRSLARNNRVFRGLDSSVLLPVDNGGSAMHARTYFYFTNRAGQKIFDVAMATIPDGNAIINGYEFRVRAIFYEILIPFVDEWWADSFRWQIDNREDIVR